METKTELIRTTLKNNVAVIQFTKVNGDHRILMGTLQHKLIPTSNEDIIVNENENRKDNGVVRVYDLTKKGWRSFHVDSLISLVLVENYAG